MNARNVKSRNLMHALLLAEQKERDLLLGEDDRDSSHLVDVSSASDIPALEAYLQELQAEGSTAFQ